MLFTTDFFGGTYECLTKSSGKQLHVLIQDDVISAFETLEDLVDYHNTGFLSDNHTNIIEQDYLFNIYEEFTDYQTFYDKYREEYGKD